MVLIPTGFLQMRLVAGKPELEESKVAQHANVRVECCIAADRGMIT